MHHVMWLVLAGTAPGLADETESRDAAPANETRDALQTLDHVFEWLATLIHIEDDEVDLGGGWVTWDAEGRTTFWDEWLVIDGDDVSVGRGWLTIEDGTTTIGGWTLPSFNARE